jgi:hypothetical protein
MKTWLKLILDIVLAFLGWRKNVADPKAQEDADYRKKHDEWEQELRRLEDAETEAGDAWRRAAAGHWIGSGGNVDKLRAEYLAASLALGHHRAGQPQCSVPGLQ